MIQRFRLCPGEVLNVAVPSVRLGSIYRIDKTTTAECRASARAWRRWERSRARSKAGEGGRRAAAHSELEEALDEAGVAEVARIERRLVAVDAGVDGRRRRLEGVRARGTPRRRRGRRGASLGHGAATRNGRWPRCSPRCGHGGTGTHRGEVCEWGRKETMAGECQGSGWGPSLSSPTNHFVAVATCGRGAARPGTAVLTRGGGGEGVVGGDDRRGLGRLSAVTVGP